MVDTETANNLTTIDPDLIEAIPVQGRDPRESMELLMPGATAAGTGSSFFIPVTSFNGVSQLSNNYDVDGGAMNDYMHGSASASFPQSENISEFSVASALPDASVPRGAGGQIEATLKNGTNQFHGQFWAYLQNGAWNANSWSNNFQGVQRQPFNQQWYGGNVGGPVWIPKLYKGKDRTFFFLSFERTSHLEEFDDFRPDHYRGRTRRRLHQFPRRHPGHQRSPDASHSYFRLWPAGKSHQFICGEGHSARCHKRNRHLHLESK